MSDRDYDAAVTFVATHRRAGASLIKQHLRLSDSKVSRLLREMEKNGVISKVQAGGQREVLAPVPIAPAKPVFEHEAQAAPVGEEA